MGFLVFSASLPLFFLALPRSCGVALRAISDAESVEAVGFGDFRLVNFRLRLKLRAENCTNVQLFHFVWLYVFVVVVGLYVTPLTNRGVRCTSRSDLHELSPSVFPWGFFYSSSDNFFSVLSLGSLFTSLILFSVSCSASVRGDF